MTTVPPETDHQAIARLRRQIRQSRRLIERMDVVIDRAHWRQDKDYRFEWARRIAAYAADKAGRIKAAEEERITVAEAEITQAWWRIHGLETEA